MTNAEDGFVEKCYILSTKHSRSTDFAFTFWGKNSSGYYFNLENAGEYSKEEAKHICEDSQKNYPVSKKLVDSLCKTYVLDNQKIGNIVENNTKNRKLLGISAKDFMSGNSGWDSSAFKSPQQYVYDNRNCIELFNKCQSLLNQCGENK